MTNGNPFYVHPGTDFGPGLMGLAQTIGKVGERKKAEEKDKIMREEVSTAIQSKDMDKIRAVAGKYPELAQNIKAIVETKFSGGSMDAYKKALFSASVDFTQAPQLMEDMRNQFAQDGIDPQEQATLDDFESLLQLDPETAQKNVEAEFAMLADEDMWKRHKDIKEGIAPAEKSLERMREEAAAKWKPKERLEMEAEIAAEHRAPPAGKAGQQYLLDDGRTRTSFDGGRTYEEDGKTYSMPSNAVKRAPLTGTEVFMEKAKIKADKAEPGIPLSKSDATEAAISGTGPYATLYAAIDAVAGGAGVDVLFGMNGFFPDTQESRIKLRAIKQLGKAALMNSPRYPVHEQRVVDRLFPDPDKWITNPRTEAKKFVELRKILKEEKQFNNDAIRQSVSPENVSALATSSIAIDRLLMMIGTGEDTIATVSNAEEYNAVPSGSQYRDPQGNVRTKR